MLIVNPNFKKAFSSIFTYSWLIGLMRYSICNFNYTDSVKTLSVFYVYFQLTRLYCVMDICPEMYKICNEFDFQN